LCEMQGMVGNSRSRTISIFMNVLIGGQGVVIGIIFDDLKDVY